MLTGQGTSTNPVRLAAVAGTNEWLRRACFSETSLDACSTEASSCISASETLNEVTLLGAGALDLGTTVPSAGRLPFGCLSYGYGWTMP